MTKFEMVGSTYQIDATCKEDAIAAFNKSCHVCCAHGMRIECDRCAIEHTHRMVLAAFDGKTSSNKKADPETDKMCDKDIFVRKFNIPIRHQAQEL